MAAPRKTPFAPAKAKAAPAPGKPRPWDANDEKRMRGDIQSNKDAASRAAARAPKAGPGPKDQMKLGEKEVFGLRSRRDMANRLAGK